MMFLLLAKSCQSTFTRLSLARLQPNVTRSSVSLMSTQGGDENEFRSSDDLARERYELRAGEDMERKRARLLYQSRKRGMLENGVILASFADKYLDELDANQLDDYDRLINLPTNDWDIFYWATKTKPTPIEFETPIMEKLRDHLKNKVSNSGKIELLNATESGDKQKRKRRRESILDGKRPDDIVMPALKKKVDLNVDISEVSLTNYKAELYSDRYLKLKSGEYIQVMTDWRKSQFKKRVKRIISSPVSLRNLSDNSMIQAFGERVDEESTHLARERPANNHVLDTPYEKGIKHHNFLQHLMSSNFTDDPLEYDQECAAWANALWHREYGSANCSIAISEISCVSCKSKIQCCDHGLPGYMPQELFADLIKRTETDGHKTKVTCQRCKFKENYKANLDADVSNQVYSEILETIRQKPPSLICHIIDLTDFPGSVLTNLVEQAGLQHHYLIVGNKLDLLPNDGHNMINRVIECFKRNLFRLRPSSNNRHIYDIMVMSARTGFNINSLVSRILNFSHDPVDVYLVGANNSGKSTLFNALLQSELSAIQEGDLLSRISTYQIPTDPHFNMLKFPIDRPNDFERHLKWRRTERVERNTAKHEKALESTTKNRQENMPHMSMLINRTELPLFENSLELVEGCVDRPKFVEGHPLSKVETLKRPPLSTTEDQSENDAFVHDVPSVTHEDQIHEFLTPNELLEVFPSETITPRKYSVRPLQSLFIAGLARLDILTCTSSIIVVVFASKYLPIHVVPTKKADQFYNTFLGSPLLGIPMVLETREQVEKDWPGLETSGGDLHLRGSKWNEGAADIVMSSIGWTMIRIKPDQECVLRAYTPGARGIFCRKPALLPYASSLAGTRKLRDTPLFENPHYKVRRGFSIN